MVLVRASLDTARLPQLGHAAREQPSQLWWCGQSGTAVSITVASRAVSSSRNWRRKPRDCGRLAHTGNCWCSHGRCTRPTAHFAYYWRRPIVDLCDFLQLHALADVS